MVVHFQIRTPLTRHCNIHASTACLTGFYRKWHEHTRLHAYTVTVDFVPKLNIYRQVCKLHIISYFQLLCPLFKRHNSGWAVHIFVLQKPGMRCAVRIHQAIYTEISIMDCLPVISAVTVYHLAIFSLSVGDRMIAPLPDKSAAQKRILVYQFKIILKVPRPIAHRMRIFA